MSAIVQATCPGCKNVLRIPADWVNQPIRCKHCGLVMQSKSPPAAAPAPPARNGVKNKAPTPVAKPTSAKMKKAEPQPVGEAVLPAETERQPVGGSPFAAIAAEVAAAPSRPARRVTKKSSMWWKGPVIALTVLVLAIGIVGVTWSKLSKLLPPSNPVGIVKDKDLPIADKDYGPPKDDASADGKIDPNKDKPATKDKPVDPNKDKTTPPKDKDKPVDPNKDKPVEVKPPPGGAFPRRALVISLHNYLYADTLGAGRTTDAHNIGKLPSKLNTGLRIPMTQIALLSDFGPKPHSPTKSVIQETLVKFLETSRPQDRVMVFFVGHVVEIGDDAYLVPIEGEFDNAAGLIPVKWVYKQLADAKAREKVLVLDVCRANPTRGAERPGSGPMGPKLAALIAAPPDGVQVWSACGGDQFSYETDAAPVGVFLDKMMTALEKGLNNKIQRPEEPLLIDLFNDSTLALMKTELDPLKLAQVPRLAGKEAPDGAAYKKDDPLAPAPTIAAGANAKDNAKIIQSVLDEISLPPIRPAFGSTLDNTIKVEMLPPFDPKIMASYPPAESPLRAKIDKVRAELWAYSNLPEPPSLKKEVAEKRAEFGKTTLALLKDTYRVVGDENKYKIQLGEEERDVGKILSNLKRLQKDFMDTDKDNPGDLRAKEPTKRWQMNYDYVLAHLDAQISFLYAYQTLLGGMRKEFPPKEPGTNGWRMVSTAEATGDSDGKKMGKNAAKLFDSITTENGGTPWFVLAKRDRMVTLGLEWKSVK